MSELLTREEEAVTEQVLLLAVDQMEEVAGLMNHNVMSCARVSDII